MRVLRTCDADIPARAEYCRVRLPSAAGVDTTAPRRLYLHHMNVKWMTSPAPLRLCRLNRLFTQMVEPDSYD